MPTWPEPAELRRAALAATVLDEVDLVPAPTGVTLPGIPEILVTWAECRRAISGARVESDLARERLTRWLRTRRWLADRPLQDIAERARPWGCCVDSPSHPGMDWVRRRVLGDALDLGMGFVGLDPADPEAVVVVPQRLLRAAGIDAAPWWSLAVVYLERMGEMAAERLRRDPGSPLRPMGDCDVVTLLGSRTLRVALAADAAGGMRTLAVPMRSRGWLDLSRVDPAFAAAASQLTEVAERGFERPLLVTRDEVVMARAGGDVARPAFEEQIAPVIDLRDVLYHRT